MIAPERIVSGPAKILAYLRMFVGSDWPGIIELRALGRVPFNGYYDVPHLQQMAADAWKLTKTRGVEGVYFSLNPVNPVLLARRVNRVDRCGRNDGATDADIVARRWLLIDVDPQRPAGISSTGEELNKAEAKAKQVYLFLKSAGWPDPLRAVSGNGWHLLYRIDLPADDGGLIQRVLKALDAKFSGDGVSVDTKVGNPSRICKLYGTYSRKGDSTADRPHRLAAIIGGDEQSPEVVPLKLLEHVAATAPRNGTDRPRQAVGSYPSTPAVEKERYVDRVERIRRAKAFFQGRPAAISGQGGHATMFAETSTAVRKLNIDRFEDYLEAVEEYNQRCEPPFSETELRHKYDQVWKTGTDEVGEWLKSNGRASDRLSREAIAAAEIMPFDGVASATVPAAQSSGLIQVLITTEEHEAVSRITSNLHRLEGVYQRGGRLVRVIEVSGSEHGIDRSGSPIVQEYPQSVLRVDMTKVADFVKEKQGKDGPILKSVHPPQWLTRCVAEIGVYETVPRLRGVVPFPCILPDGSILKEPGYDRKSGLLLTARLSLPGIPEEPTREQAVAAGDFLMSVVCDFPFVSRDHASVWLAMVCTLVSRFAFSGPAPLFLFDASTAGSGKSLLTDLASLIVMAVPAPKFANSTDDDEMRKRITAIAAAGDLMVVIDNISGSFGTPSLDAAMTADTVKDRLLGRSEIVSYPLNWVVAGTGNNCQANGDMKRRIVYSRLQPSEENPEDRFEFRFPDVRAHVLENRPSLLAAALTIVRSYIVAGRPKLGLQPMGSYEAWGSLVRNAVVWAGWPDPALTRKQFAAMSDPQATALAELLEGWSAVDPDNSGLTAAEILRSIERYPLAGEMISLALQELCSTPSGKLPSARQVGNKLKSIRGRVVNGRKLEGFINRTKTQVWRVVDATSGHSPTAGSAGSEGMVYPQAEIDMGEEEKWDRGESGPADPADPAVRFDPWELEGV